MRLMVCLKQTFDTEAKIQLDARGQIDPSDVNHIINPFDEFAVEEALCLKEKWGGEVVVISSGSDRVQESLRQTLAMGADRAVLITGVDGDNAAVAEALAAVVQKEGFDLLLCGWRAIDDQSAQVPGRLAEILRIPLVNMVTKLELRQEPEGNGGTAWTEVEGGSQVVEFPLPAIITAQRGLNKPRYPSMKGILQAKKKELKTVTTTDLGVSIMVKSENVSYSLPEQRQAGKIIQVEPTEAAVKLAEFLHFEAKVI